MTATLHRFLSAGILLVWGGILTSFYFSGRVGSYLHPSFHLWTVVSGIVLLLMAAGLIFLPAGEDADACLHPTGPRSLPGALLAALILIGPLVTASFVSQSQFGAALIANRGYATDLGQLPGYQPFSEPALPGEEGEPVETLPSSDFLPRTPRRFDQGPGGGSSLRRPGAQYARGF